MNLTVSSGPFGLREDQIERYARHLILPEVGGRGQRALLEAHVELIGDGAAAEEAVLFLAAAGVGRLTLDESLATAVRARVAALNPDTRIAVHTSTATTDLVVTGQSRLAGSMVALQTICQIVGVGQGGSWEGLDLLPDAGLATQGGGHG